MIKVKTFSSQLKIFHTRNELLELDQAVNDCDASRGPMYETSGMRRRS